MNPVIRVTGKFLDGTVQFHRTMLGCADETSAIAAFKAEPDDKVEFAWWVAPNDDCSIPRGSLSA